MTFHESFAGLENAETLILVHAAGRDHGLFTNYSFSLDFGVLADGIVDEPTP
jgi:hypothetical protein